MVVSFVITEKSRLHGVLVWQSCFTLLGTNAENASTNTSLAATCCYIINRFLIFKLGQDQYNVINSPILPPQPIPYSPTARAHVNQNAVHAMGKERERPERQPNILTSLQATWPPMDLQLFCWRCFRIGKGGQKWGSFCTSTPGFPVVTCKTPEKWAINKITSQLTYRVILVETPKVQYCSRSGFCSGSPSGQTDLLRWWHQIQSTKAFSSVSCKSQEGRE